MSSNDVNTLTVSRGRTCGLALTLAHQYPAQLPTGLQDEILGNVNSIVAFGLGGKDAQVMRREFLQKSGNGHQARLEPVPAPALIELSTGEAYAKFAGGHAIKIIAPPTMKIDNVYRAEEVAGASWERHAAPPGHRPSRAASSPSLLKPDDLLE